MTCIIMIDTNQKELICNVIKLRIDSYQGIQTKFQHLPRHQRRRGRPARRSGERQGPRRRSGRVRRRARHQQGALLSPDGLLHAAHRRRHRRGSEAHRRGDRGHHLQDVSSSLQSQQREARMGFPFVILARLLS